MVVRQHQGARPVRPPLWLRAPTRRQGQAPYSPLLSLAAKGRPCQKFEGGHHLSGSYILEHKRVKFCYLALAYKL
jgi:hypothetical protein